MWQLAEAALLQEPSGLWRRGVGGAFVAGDKWTIVTADNRPSAHYEHTLVITKSAPMLLTAA